MSDPELDLEAQGTEESLADLERRWMDGLVGSSQEPPAPATKTRGGRDSLTGLQEEEGGWLSAFRLQMGSASGWQQGQDGAPRIYTVRYFEMCVCVCVCVCGACVCQKMNTWALAPALNRG